MASLDPPDGPGGCNVAVLTRFALMGGSASLPASSLAKDPLELAGRLDARWSQLHDGDHLIAAQELHARFSVQKPAASGLKIGSFSVHCLVGNVSATPFQFEGVDPVTLNAEVGAMRCDASRGHEVLDQEQSPEQLFLGLLGLHQTRAAVATRFVSAAAHLLAMAISHRAKRTAGVPRPDHHSWSNRQLPTLTRMPVNSSLPGGHATVYTALAEVLGEVSRGGSAMRNSAALRGLADRLAENREKALVHTPTDTAVGKDLGVWLADRLIELASDPACPRWGALFALAKQEW